MNLRKATFGSIVSRVWDLVLLFVLSVDPFKTKCFLLFIIPTTFESGHHLEC